MVLINDNINNIKHNEIFSNKILGFWFYLLSDFIIFGVLFTVYIIMFMNFHCLININNIFDLFVIFYETILLLFSSFTYGISLYFIKKKKYKNKCIILLIITLILGLSFIFLELHEFFNLFSNGIYPSKNGFFSAFFTLLGMHGLHVICGLIWMFIMLFHFYFHGFSKININRFICLGLFWHLLDIIWIFIYNFVYLIGVI